MSVYSLGGLNSLSKLQLHAAIEVTCVDYQPLLVWIHIDNYNQWVPKNMVLVKAVEKVRPNTWRVEVFNRYIGPIDLPGVLLVVRVMGMVIPHLG